MAGIRAGHVVTQADLSDGLGLIVVKTIDESLASNTTLQDDDVLTLPVAANTHYILDAHILYTAASGASIGGLKMTFTVPAGTTGRWTSFGANVATSPPTDHDVVAEAFGSTRSLGGNGATFMSCSPRGNLLTSGTAGSILLRWAQHASNVTATVVRAGSWIRLQKII